MWAAITLYFLSFVNLVSYESPEYAYQPEETKYYLVAGSGSYSGWASVGAGLNVVPIWSSEATFGYTPHSYGGTTVQLNWKNIFGYRYGKLKPYGFHSAIFTNDEDTFLTLPSKYPKDYYPPTGVYSVVGAGVEYYLFKNLITYIEVSTLGYNLEAYARSPNYFEPHEVATYGIGFKMSIGECGE